MISRQQYNKKIPNLTGARRYWTKGGTLRKIPIGGAIRKKTSVQRTADVSSPTVENIPVKTEGGETSGLNIGLSIFTSSSSSKVD
nr:hypothetical protein [Tanacetum cinerariifolium]